MFHIILDMLFPKKCINCGKSGNYLCDDCLSLIDINPYYYCLCNFPRILPAVGKCEICKNNFLDGLISATSYDQKIVKQLIYKIKYGYIKELSNYLAYLILTHLLFLEKNFSDFLLIPVPLSTQKLKRRGFNQSEEIGKIVANKLSIPLFNDVLIKTKNTKAQVDLNKTERMENIKNCFQIKSKESVKNKNILLLDDVYTTGSTMNECAKILKENGAKQVIGLTVARELNII